MVAVGADLSGITNFAGAVEGFIEVLEDPRIEGMLLDKMVGTIRRSFYTETYAAAESGAGNVKHVYEWGNEQGEITPKRLYSLISSGNRKARVLSYEFKPSVAPVPLPDTSGMTGVKGNFRRHVFTAKALVMETQSNVTIYPRYAKKLFVPYPAAKRGFIMVDKARINPGGAHATGGFASWWAGWMDSRAAQIEGEMIAQAQRDVLRTGQKVVRYAAGTVKNGVKVGGRFASGEFVTIGHVNQAQNQGRLIAEAELKNAWDEDDYYEEDEY